MAFFDDFANGVTGYPVASVTLSIVDEVQVTPNPPGPSVNLNEVWSFQVRVANGGNLNMTGLSLHIEGVNGALVGPSASGPWSSLITSVPMTVNAKSSQDSVNYFFKAPSVVKPAGTTLVQAHINTFDANLNYILNSLNTHANPPQAVFARQVFPV